MPRSKKAAQNGRVAGIGDEAVRRATGKTWSEWQKILDKDGCRKLPHKQIAEIVHEKYGVGSWWSQMVTVGYEQASGLRKPHETARGWQAGVSRTINVPLSKLYSAWSDPAARRRWMGTKPVTVRKAAKNKSMRFTCADQTSLEVNFYAKGDGKGQVTVQHNKLKGEGDVAKSKKYWAASLDKLKELLARP